MPAARVRALVTRSGSTPARPASRRARLSCFALLLAALGCGDSSSPEGFGTIDLQTITAGEPLDPDGYQVTVDNIQVASVPVSGEVTIADQSAGSRSVRLVGVAENCTVAGDNPKIVNVTAGETATVTFTANCGTGIGSAQVQVVTTGGDIDPDGYVIYANDQPTAAPSNGEILITGLPAFVVQFQIDHIAPNCTIVGEAQREIEVPLAGQVQLQYQITCLGPQPNDLVFPARLTTSDANAPEDIFRVNATGTRVRNLTMSPDRELSASWSPDGARIAFAALGLSIMNADGTNVMALGLDPAVGFPNEPAWSPDGGKLAVAGFRDLFILNSDGTGLTNLTNRTCIPGAECGGIRSPSWSPDGTRIAYSFFRGFPLTLECYVSNSDGTGNHLVNGHCADPAWSPDGSRIAFDVGGHVFVMGADGSGVTDLSVATYPFTTDPNAEDSFPSWSPDGSKIAFVSTRLIPEELFGGGGRKIFVMNADGTSVRHVTLWSEFADVGRPTWGPAAQ